MTLIKIYRNGSEESKELENVQRRLKSNGIVLTDLKVETCFYVQLTTRLRQLDHGQLLSKLKRIVGDTWEINGGLFQLSQFVGEEAPNKSVIEIGPRLSFSTPWSTNCVNICKSAALEEVERLEKAVRYFVTFQENVTDIMEIETKIVSLLHDPMTQQRYPNPLETFSENRERTRWSMINIIEGGRDELERVNKSMGLAFDDWDLNYYTELFQKRICRNPTTVELFDLAQSNSEHSRHWFFKGEYEVDGKKLPNSLLDLVINTNVPEYTNQNNVIKFCDNSSGIMGWSVPVLTSSNPSEPNEYKIKNCTRHIIFTAETHNFPTGVSPFSGATTGTGGRIRDVEAAGRGGHVIAGTAGYCFGNLHIPGYDLEWEEKGEIYPTNFASPLEVAIEASNGASDYGNKFGEPVICGFARSFGMRIGKEKAERREWIKPIMFSGGMGSLDDDMIHKYPPKSSQFVVKIGGPVYRIGVGGGAASSVQVQGDNVASRDIGAVQRGDAEMEQKLNRVIRSCLEIDCNPILSIHDQGAGGNANVLKELMEGAGGIVFTKAFTLGDPTLSTLEVWGAEYQESNALLVEPSHYSSLEKLCRRERCPIDKVGVITSDGKVRVYETEFQEEEKVESESSNLPVNLKLDWVLGKMPKKTFKWTKRELSFPRLELAANENATILSALKRVLALPSVASKRYLTNKVDRSVTGLIAQQQCVGPRQTPISDVAVTALSYFSKEGGATSIGEQPVKLLIDPCAGARVTVLESLSNLVPCLITDLKDVKCSANWMWPAKLEGEGYSLYEACNAMCEIMKQLGIAVDGGKDSLSMAARVASPSKGDSQIVKAPGSLVVSAYAPCPNISKIITPDVKSPSRNKNGKLLLIKPAFECFRTGGSALAQVYSQTGSMCPDVQGDDVTRFIACFKAIQTLIKDEQILSIHDVSDGGLITCLIEMAIGGWGGMDIHLPRIENASYCEVSTSLSALFNEEIGWVAEIDELCMEEFLSVFRNFEVGDVVKVIGSTIPKTNPAAEELKISYDEVEILTLSLSEASQLWEETSFQLEKLQINPDLALEENVVLKSKINFECVINFSWNKNCLGGPQTWHPKTPRMAVIREEGSNGDRELAAAFIQAGFLVHDVAMSDFATMKVNLDQFRGIAFPGGFSYADVLGSGVGWALSIRERREISEALENWKSQPTTFSLGVCNGCQLMALLGWVGTDGHNSPAVKLDTNNSGRFESRWTRIKIPKSNSLFFRDMEDSVLGIWVAHGEGKFTYKCKETRQTLMNSGNVALQYVDGENQPTEKYPFNPNGSLGGVAGLTSSCGRHLAMMPHPERCFLTWQWPHISPSSAWSSDIAPWSKMFQNAFDWCLKTS